MRPQIFDLHFAALRLVSFSQRPQPHAFVEAIRNIGVNFDCHFSATALGFYDSRQGNKIAARLRCSYSIISSA